MTAEGSGSCEYHATVVPFETGVLPFWFRGSPLTAFSNQARIFKMSDERKERYRKVEHIRFAEVPTGYVIDDDRNKRIIFLNLAAAAILELCDGTNDVALIADLMKNAYNLSAAPYDDVEACVWLLYRAELIERMSSQQFRFLSFLRRLVKK
jgi:hypothetical protein